jgi:hypothetical protein
MRIIRYLTASVRWIICFPGAMLFSFLVYGLAITVFSSAFYGPGVWIKVVGLTPLLLRTLFPTIAFVLSGILLSPSTGRKVVLVFSVLALLFSVSGFEVVKFKQNPNPNPTFLWTASVGIVVGALLGCYLGLMIQARRRKGPNHATEPPAASGTSAAGHPPRQP